MASYLICSLCTICTLSFLLYNASFVHVNLALSQSYDNANSRLWRITLCCQNASFFLAMVIILQYQIVMKIVLLSPWRSNYNVKLIIQWGQYKSLQTWLVCLSNDTLPPNTCQDGRKEKWWKTTELLLWCQNNEVNRISWKICFNIKRIRRDQRNFINITKQTKNITLPPFDSWNWIVFSPY